MDNKPKISVVIPAFNEEDYLPACLEALQRQTFKDFEIIVVDNNSKDKTAEIAKQFGARVVREAIQGMIAARQRGFKEAKSEIIARTDADTQVPPNWLEIIYDTFRLYPKSVAIMGTYASSYSSLSNILLRIFTYISFVTLGKLLAGHVLLLGPNMAVRKSAWKKIRVHMDDKLVHEDIDLACHLAKIGEILFMPNLPVPLSLRWISKNPIQGTIRYLKYPIRYFQTILIHYPYFGH